LAPHRSSRRRGPFWLGRADSRIAAVIDALKEQRRHLRRTETKALSERSIATPSGGKSTARSVLNLTTRLSEGVAEVHVRRDRTTFMFTETVPMIG
jgi:hypothetical protein